MSAAYELHLRDLYYADTPTLWWSLDRTELHLQEVGRFDLSMRAILPDDDLVDRDDRSRSAILFSQSFTISEQLETKLRRLAAMPSSTALLQVINLPSGVGLIPGYSQTRSVPWITDEEWSELLLLKRRLEVSALNTLNCFFWRLGLHEGPSVLESGMNHLEFRLNGDQFHKVPVTRIYAPDELFGESRAVEDEKFQIAQEFLRHKSSAPLHHSLFQEASRRSGEPRVAFIMAVVAAESAIKFLIAQCIPEAEWLIENVPSPPIKKLIRDFLPGLKCKLTISGEVVPPISAELKVIETAFDLRNKLVHGVKVELRETVVQSTLDAVKHFLALVDFYSGEKWAFERISKEVQAQLQFAAISKSKERKK